MMKRLRPACDTGPSRLGGPARWIACAVLSIAVVCASAWLAGQWFAADETRELARRAEVAAGLRGSLLQSELERHRSLPFVLAQDPDVHAALLQPDPGRIAALNHKLEALSRETRAAVIYAVASDGTTRAASNWREPTSFVGANYAFRPYFRQALKEGYAESFALGTLSRHPGLFLARRVNGARGPPVGVVVVKLHFDALEASWRGGDELAFVTESRGIVLITSRPDWRFNTLKPIPPEEIRALRAAQQFGADARFEQLPLRITTNDTATLVPSQPGTPSRYALARLATATTGWTLHVLLPADTAILSAVSAGRIAGAASMALLLAGLLALLWARGRARRESARRDAARIELESRVAERTRELSEANTRLVQAMDERRRSEATRQRMQDELVQATKLAVLGQVTAGVAHEINQPLTAIRSYVDSAAILLGRGDATAVRENLGAVAELTERIGLITRELRAFARKSSAAAKPVRVHEALDGALLLVSARLRSGGVELQRDVQDASLTVLAPRVRLEQVLVNLLQNAIDAVAQVPEPKIRLSVELRDGSVEIRVGDNGPGLTPELRGALFTPFLTTKPQGLGLGLVISRDILVECGGTLEHFLDAAGNTVFVVGLRSVQ